jgi:hypothetical protein
MLAVITAALAAAAAAVHPCTTCRAPIWSWDEFPAFFHGCDPDGAAARGGFTPEALATLARFRLVTIEKWQGGGVVPSMWEEEAFVVAARQIKAANPNITVIAWLDSVRVYQQNLTLNPYAGYQCNTMGKLGAARYLDDPANRGLLLKNSTGGLVHEAMGCHVYDAGSPDGARAFQELCLNLTSSGVIDGCGADASWINLTGTKGERQKSHWGVTDAAAKAWREGHQRSLRELSWPLLGQGLLLGKYPYEVGDYVSGALDENCPPHNDTINWLRGLQAKQLNQGRPLYYECHYKSVDGNLSDAVAAFLAGVGPNQYFGLGAWEDVSPAGVGNFSHHWIEGVFGRKLGAPLAGARLF